MVSGLPVLVPRSHEYIAQLTRKYGVGLVFDSPRDLDSLLFSVTEDEYRSMRLNAYDLGKKISRGYFFKKAISSVVEWVKGEVKVRTLILGHEWNRVNG